ncbi:MAG: excinuclease ABC subunit UvrC [Bacteroidia bacterium]|nr:excinuclease ABC subunit UvrC [Bacteroidia bacterium]MDW8159104.1 excinuclease ABC subunit UvrC [Bacteroidia bacterium]
MEINIIPSSTPDQIIDEIRRNIPELPGIYKYRDKNGNIIYVGKAINLKKRVNSYFTRNNSHDLKTQRLVSQICSIEFVITEDEREALLLENNLIKEHQPKYNILLRDGKSYSYICIKNEPFPRVFITRKRLDDGSTYFGPYPGSETIYQVMEFIRKNFKLRNCKLPLSTKNIEQKKFRACLEYHIGNCKAPCVGKQTEAEYNNDIMQIRHVLDGNFDKLEEYLRNKINEAANCWNFEQAHELKKHLEKIQDYKAKCTIVSQNIYQLEVVTLTQREKLVIAYHFKIFKGTVIRTHAFDIWINNQESYAEILNAVLTRLAAEDEKFYYKVLSNINVEDSTFFAPFEVISPTTEEEQRLVELAIKNSNVLLEQKLNSILAYKRENVRVGVLEQLQKDLNLPHIPYHIEGFDNANIQGDTPVSSIVVFKNGKPAKREYRVMNIQTVKGPNDFETIREVVYRRYRRVLEEGGNLPDLIVIDGGKGQLSHAIEALQELNLHEKIPVIGIAKRLEEIYFKNDPLPLWIDKKSSSLKLLQYIRNEAHRAANSYHRKKRSEKFISTELTQIKGIGNATAQRLLREFKSIEHIKQAPLEQIAQIIGKAKATLVFNYFQAKNTIPN